MKKLFMALPALMGLFMSIGHTNLPAKEKVIDLTTANVDDYGTVSIGIGDFDENAKLPFTAGLQDCAGCGCKDW